MPFVDGVEHSMIRVNDLDMHVAQAGAGPPLLLLHGYPQHWYVWRALIPPLAESHRVICPDLRGFGWSQAAPRGYDKETLTWDVLALLDELDVRSVSVAGHDWGGWIGMLIGMLAPNRLERVLIMSVSHPWLRLGPWTAAMWGRTWHGLLLGTPRRGPSAAPATTWRGRRIAKWLGGDSWSDEERHIFLDQFEETDRARAAHLLYWDYGMTDLVRVRRGKYRRIGLRAPALALHGERDRAFIPWRAKDYEPYAPNLSHEVVRDAGHALVEDRPELILERIRTFLLS